MAALVMVLVAGGVGLVLWRASLAAFVGHTMTPGALLQFVILSALAAGAAGSLSETWGGVQKAAGAMGRSHELLAAGPSSGAPALPRPAPPRPTPSWRLCPTATGRRWVIARGRFRAGSASVWPLAAPWSGTPRSCFWTKRPAPWTPRTSGSSSGPCTRP